MPPSKILVELMTDIANMGRKGAIVEVSTAQARNFLIPKKLAKEVTAERMKQIEIEEKRTKDQARLRLEQAYEIKNLLEGQKIEYTLKGKNGKIFGGINEHDVITRIAQKWKIDFEKHDVRLPNKTHIKTVGSHLVYLHITRETIAKMLIEVTLES